MAQNQSNFFMILCHMAGELCLIAKTSGLTVDADIHLNGRFSRTVRLVAEPGAPTCTVYVGDMPTNSPAGKYTITYRIVGNPEIQGPDTILWTGTAEVDFALLQQMVSSMRGTGFLAATDSLEALSNAISAIGQGTGGGGSTNDGFNAQDRVTLDRIEEFARDAASGAIGDFSVNNGQFSGTLKRKDGSTAATFLLYDAAGQPSIVNAVQRRRI
jgi:hypothetical protein